MRISVVTGPFIPFPPAPSGAVEKIWHGLARRFAARGHEVHLVGRGWEGCPEEEVVDGVRIVRRFRPVRGRGLPSNLAKDLLYSGRISRFLPASDVVLVNSFFLPLTVPLLARRAGRLVVHIQRWPKRQVPLYLHADRIAVPSQPIADAIVRQTPRAGRIVRVIPNPVDLSTFAPPEDRTRERGSTPRGRVRVLYAGRVHPEKGLDLLVKAAARLQSDGPPIEVRVVGPVATSAGGGGDDYLRSLEALAPATAVTFLPPIGDPALLAAEMREADVFCYPSVAAYGEASPVAPLEAMAAGAVPVVSGLEVFRQHVRHGENGVVFDHTAADAAGRLADAIRSLASDEAARDRMSLAARRHAAGFDYPAVADLYLADFEEVCRTRRDPRAGRTRPR